MKENPQSKQRFSDYFRTTADYLRKVDKKELGKTIGRACVRCCRQQALAAGLGLLLTATGLPDVSSLFDSDG